MNQAQLRPRIVVVGSLNMDLVVSTERMPRIGETIQGQEIHYIPGGKGANQAVGCAKLGAEAIMIGAVGDDSFGRIIMSDLHKNGVDIDRIKVESQTATGTATILHTPQDNCIIVVPGANRACDETFIIEHEEVIRTADVLLVQLEIPLPAVKQALAIARAHGVKTILNPAPAQPLDSEILALADLLTPNETEFESLLGRAAIQDDVQLAEAVRAWQTLHGHSVIVTRGKRGSAYLDEETGDLRIIPAILVEVVDTTGAGDAFNAALSVGLAYGWTLEDAVTFASKAASISTTAFGAQGGMPTLEQVKRWKLD